MNQAQPGYRRLEGSERDLPPGGRRVGPADASAPVAVTIYVRRRPDAPPLPDLHRVDLGGAQAPMSRRQFADAYGAAQADLDSVIDFARSHGLTVDEVNAARRAVKVSGSVEQMNQAFGVDLGQYESPLGRYRGREGHVYVPDELADVVEGVFGLDNRPIAHPGGFGGALLLPTTPPEVASFYNYPASNAVGQTIAVFEFSGPTPFSPTCGYNVADIKAFFDQLNLPLPTLRDVLVDGATNTPSPGVAGSPDSEVALDIDVAGSIGTGADIAVYFAPNTLQGWVDSLATALHPDVGQPAPSVVSISWGGVETTSWNAAGRAAFGAKLQDAALLGVTVLLSTGDKGSDCGTGDGLAHVQYPASDPLITACGGTFVATDPFTGQQSEGTWNDSAGTTGGGVSEVFALPPWQVGLGVPASLNAPNFVGRGVPDVSGNGSPNSGYPITFDGQQKTFGGTSATAPLYAGLVALINANLNQPLGFLNPLLYSLAGTNVFVDIRDGVNNHWSGGPSATPSYTSGAGWDACTGLGRLDGTRLLGAVLKLKEGAQMINPDDPFKFGPQWRQTDGDSGGDDSGDDVSLGESNTADDDNTTWINTSCTRNATLFVENRRSADGVVGLFGRSHGATRSIGVAGESDSGCGVYGIATSGTTIGVAGRSMGAVEVEDDALEKVVGEPVGVLGHSTLGPGVRGHGGPLAALAPGVKPPPAAQASPGGVFSAGHLQEIPIAEVGAVHKLGVDSLPQLRMVPSTNTVLPPAGQFGDIYANVTGDVTDPGGTISVSMYLCVQPGDGQAAVAMWAPFQLGAPQPGGQ